MTTEGKTKAELTSLLTAEIAKYAELKRISIGDITAHPTLDWHVTHFQDGPKPTISGVFHQIVSDLRARYHLAK